MQEGYDDYGQRREEQHLSSSLELDDREAWQSRLHMERP